MEEILSEKTWLEGRISVEASLLGRNRSIEAIYILKGRNHSFNRLLELAKATKVPVEIEGQAFFAEQARGKSHGGVIALVGPRKFYQLNELPMGGNNPFFVMLDGVEDPFNFGQAVRALYASGVSGLVVRNRNWLSAAGVVTRASAGASELILTAVVDSALDAARYFREREMLIACTTRQSAVSIFDCDLTQPLFLLIGGEKRGITRSFLDQADLRLRIPYGRTFAQSLGVTASTAILAFEIMRQRQSG